MIGSIYGHKKSSRTFRIKEDPNQKDKDRLYELVLNSAGWIKTYKKPSHPDAGRLVGELFKQIF